jgi:hypothetical protein
MTVFETTNQVVFIKPGELLSENRQQISEEINGWKSNSWIQ